MIFTIGLVTSSLLAGSQTLNQINEIRKNSKIKKLQSLQTQLRTEQANQKQRALELAQQNNWPVEYTDDQGTTFGLIGVTEDNKPLYYQTDNVAAARSTRTNWLHQDGGLGLNIEGQGMTAHVWDAGVARATHQEYDGAGGSNRFSIGDGTTTRNFHGAHVMGTIIASGFVANAKGMAPQARGKGHNWDFDIAEATDAAINDGMLISNHSYGFVANGIPDSWFGAYIRRSRQWDELMYNAPYYMMVVSAGNDGNNNTANGDPLNGSGLFDKLNGFKTTKNNLVIANAQDAQIDADGNVVSVEINSSSSEGPTDDLRVKPDLTGNGTGVFSTYESADDAYNTISGTSMAAPNVAGSLLLLQQYYNELSGTFMRSSTLKGLALHTADDMGTTGPDPIHGWGLMNTKRAAETLTNNGFQSWVTEEVLEQGQSYSITVKSDGVNPLQASISWTDLPGPISAQSNSSTPVLVNDLDIRITQNSDTFEPWRLTSVQGNGRGDNIVDPFERVDVDGAIGDYTITVTHKGTLADGPQAFALIITGLDSNFRFDTETASLATCSDTDAEFVFNHEQQNAGTTNFTVEGVPAGATTNFSSPSLNANGSTTLTISNLEVVPAGTYDLVVVGDDGNESERRNVTLRVFHPDFDGDPMIAASPSNGERDVPFSSVNLTWEENLNAESYEVEVSDNPSFTNIVATGTVNDQDFEVSGLNNRTVYYWRVKPSNSCVVGDFSEVYSFQTGGEDCSNVFSPTNYSGSDIPPNPGTGFPAVAINVNQNLTMNRLIVETDISHTSVEDLTLILQLPGSLNTEQIILMTGACGDSDDIDAIFDDTGAPLNCNASGTAITGTVVPGQSLSSLVSGQPSNGRWFFLMEDDEEGNGGSINEINLTVCSVLPNGAAPDFTNNGIDVAANGSYTIQTSDIEASTVSETSDQQVYTVVELPSRGNLVRNGVTLAVGDTFTQEDVDNGLMDYTNSQTAIFTDSFRVDITNAVDGWLANQTINISSSVVSTESFELSNFSLFPNPTDGIIFVKFETSSSARVGVQIFDLQGRTIFERAYNSDQVVFEQSINIGNIANGVYIVQVNQGDRSTTKNMIISK
jgi:subtilisin-like proprotein convertase family protein